MHLYVFVRRRISFTCSRIFIVSSPSQFLAPASLSFFNLHQWRCDKYLSAAARNVCCPSCRPVSATAWCSRLWRHRRMRFALLAFQWTKCECWRFKVHSRTQCFWARWKTKITVFVCALNILLYDCALINHLFYINFVRWLNKKLFYLVNCAPARAYENSCQPIIKSGRGHAYPAGWSVC